MGHHVTDGEGNGFLFGGKPKTTGTTVSENSPGSLKIEDEETIRPLAPGKEETFVMVEGLGPVHDGGKVGEGNRDRRDGEVDSTEGEDSGYRGYHWNS